MNDVEMVKKLGESIGYGHLMEIAHELWAEDLEAVGLPREGAFCVAAEYQIKKRYVGERRKDPSYSRYVREKKGKQ